MLSVLAEREYTVNELAEALNKSQPLMSWHLRRLKAAGIVKIRRSGREVFCSLDRDAILLQQQQFRDLIGLPISYPTSNLQNPHKEHNRG